MQLKYVPDNLYMWQSQVEIEHYSIVYFNHITAFIATALAQNFC